MVKSKGDRIMTKQEQVENIAKERNEIKDIMKLLDKCVSLNPMCKAEVATIIYGNNYRKIPEDSVVLTQDEWNDENHLAQRFGYDLGSKETAEKFVNETIKRKQTLMNPYTDDESECVSTFWIYKLAKQFGVEI